jgi:D-beta-D-heptose 7-phosphate kinase/D-beta-D-heptose 1-phosphate adenosyltransferase
MSGSVDLVRRFRRLRVVALGDAILDTYLQGTAERLCVEGPAPVVRKLDERSLPGGAANTAANLRALGAQVTFLGVVGADAAGRALREMLRARGIDDRYLIEDDTVTTQHKLRIIADGQYVVRCDEGTAHAPSAQAQQRLLDGLDELAGQCDAIVVSDYCYGVISEPLMRRALELRQRLGIPLLIDSKQIGRFGRLSGAIVTPNLLEARSFVSGRGGQEIPESQANDTRARVTEGRRLADALLTLLDVQLAAVTLAADGVALVSREGQRWHVPAYPVVRPHEVGAGDSFTSALALALAAGAMPDEAARIGVDAAGIAVSKRFTSQVEQRELLQRVSLREHADDDLTDATGPTAQRQALSRVRAMLDLERAAGRVIVFTNGVFDVLNAGHIEFLRRAKALGDTLIVGVNSDESVRRFAGARAPLMSERDRLALLVALEPVDYALLFDDETPVRLIRALRPHIHVKGGDYADEALPEAEAVRAVGGRVVILPLAGAGEPGQEPRRVGWRAGGDAKAEGNHAHAG